MIPRTLNDFASCANGKMLISSEWCGCPYVAARTRELAQADQMLAGWLDSIDKLDRQIFVKGFYGWSSASPGQAFPGKLDKPFRFVNTGLLKPDPLSAIFECKQLPERDMFLVINCQYLKIMGDPDCLWADSGNGPAFDAEKVEDAGFVVMPRIALGLDSVSDVLEFLPEFEAVQA